MDHQGKPIKCEGSVCEGDFDFTWTQHTAYRIDEKSDKNIVYVTAFDNGDARGMDQPALPEMKYSRAVIYKIDQKARTIEQVWQYGKERGYSWYSPVTSLTKYFADKDSVMVYSATAGMGRRPCDEKPAAQRGVPGECRQLCAGGQHEFDQQPGAVPVPGLSLIHISEPTRH